MPTTVDDSRRVLELLAQGKITVDEADQLLRALREEPRAAETPGAAGSAKPSPRWVLVSIEARGRDGRPPKTVTIRMPIAVARSGLRFGAMFRRFAGQPFAERLRQEGLDIDLSQIDLSQFDRLLEDMGETVVDVDGGRAQIRVRCE